MTMHGGQYSIDYAEHVKIVDQHVVHYVNNHPSFCQDHSIQRVRNGVYRLDGSQIAVDWCFGESPCDDGYLAVVDGSVSQPFTDYVTGSDDNRRRIALSMVKEDSLPPVASFQSVAASPVAVKVNDLPPVASFQTVAPPNVAVAPPVAKAPTPARANTCVPAAKVPPAPTTHGSPVYCAVHNMSERRAKTEERKKECMGCNKTIQTNYVEFMFCPDCSQAHNACMCCGVSASAVNEPSTAQGPPVYCAKHDTTEKRIKTHPRNVACASCQAFAQTNYKEFTLCHGCSHVEQRCICCGDSVATPGVVTQDIGNLAKTLQNSGTFVKTLQNSPTNSAWPLFANLGTPVNALLTPRV